MKTAYLRPPGTRIHFFALALLLSSAAALAQWPQLTSSDPPNGAVNVPVTKAVVFRFSVPMDPDLTMAIFQTLPGGMVTMEANSWADNFTTMTCRPLSTFPDARVVTWYLVGTSMDGEDLLPMPVTGTFTTGQGSGEDCTNYVGTFTVAKGAMFQQTSAGSATPYPDVPFIFLACSDLACSNRTSTNLLISIPSNPVSTVPIPPKPQAGSYNLSLALDNQTALEGTYPNGTYTFQAQSPTFSRSYAVNFPTTLAMPAAPHVKNYTAAQAINPNQDFVLEWDDFTSHSSAGVIYVEVYGYFRTPALGEPTALTAAAKSVTIPAGTLSANNTYSVGITFYDYVQTENSTHLSLAYRGATTELEIRTSDGSGMPDLVLSNPSLTLNPFSVEVDFPSGHYLEFQFNSSLSPAGWSTLYGTNTPGGTIRFTDPTASNTGARFYRVNRVF
jgi:hypothetical protein